MASSSSGKPRSPDPIGIPDPPPDPSRRENEPVLDTMVLQAFGFGHPEGIETLLRILLVERARFPAEVYNGETLPLTEDDEDLSELALGLDYAERQIRTRPWVEAERFESWIDNASQLEEHLQSGSLEIDPLRVGELPEREDLMETYGIGRGEAACLVLARRHGAPAVFVSADQEACEVADEIGIPRTTIRDLLERWVNVFSPSLEEFDAIVEGLRRARFDPGEDFVGSLRERLH
jgi:predicted nucleic acid-binding protein